MGPPLRSFAPDAHCCIMVWVGWTHRIQGCGAMLSRPTAGFPRSRHPDRNKRAVVLGAFKARPCGRAEERGLDSPCARRRSMCVGRGEETELPDRTKETGQKKMEPCSAVLTRKAPYKETAGCWAPGSARAMGIWLARTVRRWAGDKPSGAAGERWTAGPRAFAPGSRRIAG
jgi:hypothetical protein